MSTELLAENERLKASNKKLAMMLSELPDKLEAGRRELLATGWDAATEAASKRWDVHPSNAESLKADNPYRKPVIDLTGAIICKTGDNQ